MTITRLHAVLIGAAAILVVLLLQGFNSFACYKHSFSIYLSVVGSFLLAPLLPAVVALFFPNALRAVGACALLAPWLLLAYFVDCVRPYSGGGASMIYIAVLLWGTPSAIIGALITGPIMRRLGIEIQLR
jgi:hypothetical protein